MIIARKAILIVGLICVASAAHAKGLAHFLDLTPQQSVAIHTIRAELEIALHPLKVEVAMRERALAEVLDQDEPQPLQAGVIVTQIHRLRGQIAMVREHARAQSVELLSAEQQERLDPLQLSATLAPIAAQAVHLNLVAPPPHVGYGH